jgi:hypothetical protein
LGICYKLVVANTKDKEESMNKGKLIFTACFIVMITAVSSRFARADAAEEDAIPEALKPPPGQVHALTARGVGVQIYECSALKDDPAQFSWALKAPEATLQDDTGKVLGKHYAGPTWEAVDGTKVVGELVAKVDPPDASSIPWLLLRAKSTNGRGTFGAISFVQRLHTVGGKAPTTGCDPAHAGNQIRVPYPAIYRYYAVRG